MGSNTSKPGSETAVDLQRNIIDPINSDPRSPSPEIVRTPLQDKTDTKHSITKNVDLTKTFQDPKTDVKGVQNNPILAAVIKNHLQSYDPRSPTHEFDRTPIVIASKISEEKQVSRQQLVEDFGTPCAGNDFGDNDHLKDTKLSTENIVPKNLCDGFLDMTLDDAAKEAEEPLGSSTASQEVIESDITDNCLIQPTRLLETDFDYVDEGSHKLDNETGSESKCALQLLENDPRSPSEGIKRTPIIITKVVKDTIQENVEAMSDETLIQVLQNTNSEFRQTLNRTNNTNKESLLIYEDESDTAGNETPKKTKSASTSGSRTPLSCMKNKTGQTRPKSMNTLCEQSDKQSSKLSKHVSHIPRLKSLSKLRPPESSLNLKNISKIATVAGDCENTPPQSTRDCWDKNSSIVL